MALGEDVSVENALRTTFISVEEYLTSELKSGVRHEYIGGAVYAMAGESRRHNLICGNIYAALRAHLRGKGCQVYMEDVKLRLQIKGEDIFYYPDLVVTCDPHDNQDYFVTTPKVLIEVESPSTERIDRREKFASYVLIDSLAECVRVGPDRMEVAVSRRANDWSTETLTQSAQVLRLPSLGFDLPLAAIYESAGI